MLDPLGNWCSTNSASVGSIGFLFGFVLSFFLEALFWALLWISWRASSWASFGASCWTVFEISTGPASKLTQRDPWDYLKPFQTHQQRTDSESPNRIERYPPLRLSPPEQYRHRSPDPPSGSLDQLQRHRPHGVGVNALPAPVGPRAELTLQQQLVAGLQIVC